MRPLICWRRRVTSVTSPRIRAMPRALPSRPRQRRRCAAARGRAGRPASRTVVWKSTMGSPERRALGQDRPAGSAARRRGRRPARRPGRRPAGRGSPRRRGSWSRIRSSGSRARIALAQGGDDGQQARRSRSGPAGGRWADAGRSSQPPGMGRSPLRCMQHIVATLSLHATQLRPQRRTAGSEPRLTSLITGSNCY